MITALLATASLIAVSQTPPRALQVGKTFYVAGPAIRLCNYPSSVKFSRDGKFLSYIDEFPEWPHAQERERIRQDGKRKRSTVMRVDIPKGVKQVLYTPTEDETLMSVEPLGMGGDVLVHLAVGVSRGDKVDRRVLYCPVGGSPRLVIDRLPVKSFHIATSETENKAFVLICNPGEETKYLFITASSTVEKSLGISGEQGLFFLKSARGYPILGIQGPPPNYSLIGNFEMNFKTGEAIALRGLPENKVEEENLPLIEYDWIRRGAADASLGQSILDDLFATPGKPGMGKGKYLFAQATTVVVATAPNGLAVVYGSAEGYFVKEMLEVTPAYAAKLAKPN